MRSVVDRSVGIQRIPVVKTKPDCQCSAPVSLCAAVRRDVLTYLS